MSVPSVGSVFVRQANLGNMTECILKVNPLNAKSVASRSNMK